MPRAVESKTGTSPDFAPHGHATACTESARNAVDLGLTSRHRDVDGQSNHPAVITGLAPFAIPSKLFKRLSSPAIRGKEQLNGQFGNRDLERHVECAEHAEERPLAAIGRPDPDRAEILREVGFACCTVTFAGQVVIELLEQPRELVVSGSGELALDAITKVGHDIVGIDDLRHQLEADAEDVDRRVQQSRVDGRDERCYGGVCRDQVPVTVEDDSWIRLVTLQNPLQRFADRSEFRCSERVLRECGSMTSGKQQAVTFTKRNVESLAKAQQHVSPWLGAAGLDETQMARRYARIQGQF